MVEAQRYHDIFVGAADEFRSGTSEAEGVRFLQMVHDRLGAVRSTTQSGWRVNFTPGGSTVSLNYNTQFASGAGTENFVFRIGGAQCAAGRLSRQFAGFDRLRHCRQRAASQALG